MERGVLYRATTSDPEPASEFEISACVQLTYDTPRPNDLVLFLRRRLQKENSHIKLKTLKLLKHLSERGRSDFRKVVQLNLADYIRTLQSYRGPPDPVRGDFVSQEIRDAALQCLSSIFAAENNSASAEYVPASPCSKFRFSSERNSSIDRLENSGCSKRMTGFGNMPPPPSGPPQREVPNDAIQGIKMILGTIGQKLPHTWATTLGISKAAKNNGNSTYSENPNRIAGFDPGAACSRIHNDPTPTSGNCSNFASFARRSPHNGLYSENTKFEGLSSEPGVYEDRLVQKLIQPVGARVAPQAKSLDEFVSQCRTLDLDTILLIVLAKIQSNSATWQQNLRCLYILKALLSAPDDANEDMASKVRLFFTNHPKQEDVVLSCKDFGYCGPLVSEVMSLLRVRKKDFGADPSSPVEPSSPDEVVSLLDLEDEEVGKRNRFPLQSLLRTTKSLLGNSTTKSLLDFNEEETLAI